MRFAPLSIAATAAMLLAAAGPTAANAAFDRLWVFGDSTVDTGWYNFRPSGESQFDQYLSTYNLARPPHTPRTFAMGRPTSSPGPVSVEILAGLIGTDVLPADQTIPLEALPLAADLAISRALDLIIEPPPGIFPLFTGTNYATGGARNQAVNTPATGLFPGAVPTETQIANYLATHLADGNALYLISSGANDVSFALSSAADPQTAADPTAYLTGAADSLAASIATLQQRGARYIIVTNLPESFGTTDQQTWRHFYNAELMSKLTSLGVNFAWGDMNSVRSQIVANPALFGITHTTNSLADRACTTPAETTGIASAWAYVCSPTSPVSQPISATFAQQALFSDNEHWATGGHTILGSYYLCLAAHTWPQQFQIRFGRFIFPIVPRPPTPCSSFQQQVVSNPQ